MSEIRRFTDCVDLVGTSCKQFEGQKKYISTGAVKDNKIVEEDVEIIEFDTKPSRANLCVENGDVLFAKMQATEKLLSIDDELSTNVYSTGFCAVRPKKDILTKDCLYFVLSSKFFNDKKDKECAGATQKAINNDGLRKIELRIPEISKQKEIATTLSTISNIISLRQQQLSQLDELVKARFVEMFGDPIINNMRWSEELIGDNCFVTKLAGFEYTQYIHYEDSGDVAMVKAQNVKNGRLNEKDMSFISNEVSNSLPRSQLAVGDVVMTYVGANIGDVAIIDDKHKYHLAPNVAKIRPNAEKYNSIYLMYMLMFLNSYIIGNSADTAKAALGMKRIRKLKVFVPPIELQNQFADFVKQVDKSKFACQESIKLYQELLDKKMDEYFNPKEVPNA